MPVVLRRLGPTYTYAYAAGNLSMPRSLCGAYYYVKVLNRKLPTVKKKDSGPLRTGLLIYSVGSLTSSGL